MWHKQTQPPRPNSPPRPAPTSVAARTSPRPYAPCSASPKSATPQPNHDIFALMVNKPGPAGWLNYFTAFYPSAVIAIWCVGQGGSTSDWNAVTNERGHG